MEDEIKKEETQEETQVSEKPLEEMTVKELREIAKEIPGVTGFSVMRKEELLAVIYEARGVEKEIKEERQELKKPLEKMTVKELKEVALEIPGVTGVTSMKKEELLDIIKKDRGIEDEKPAQEKKKKSTKPTASVKELKKKIVQFRLDKQKAREAKDRKKVDILEVHKSGTALAVHCTDRLGAVCEYSISNRLNTQVFLSKLVPSINPIMPVLDSFPSLIISMNYFELHQRNR